jgi:hypothetical protein
MAEASLCLPRPLRNAAATRAAGSKELCRVAWCASSVSWPRKQALAAGDTSRQALRSQGPLGPEAPCRWPGAAAPHPSQQRQASAAVDTGCPSLTTTRAAQLGSTLPGGGVSQPDARPRRQASKATCPTGQACDPKVAARNHPAGPGATARCRRRRSKLPHRVAEGRSGVAATRAARLECTLPVV